MIMYFDLLQNDLGIVRFNGFRVHCCPFDHVPIRAASVNSE